MNEKQHHIIICDTSKINFDCSFFFKNSYELKNDLLLYLSVASCTIGR